jgi:hypothetical protein
MTPHMRHEQACGNAKSVHRSCVWAARALISKDSVTQRPDAIVVDASSRRTHTIEVVRTEDSTNQLYPTNAATLRSF